ncbi:hypothetical protein [Streptomyces sp. NPDC003996]
MGYPPLMVGPAFAPLVGGWKRTACIGGVSLLLCLARAWCDDMSSMRRSAVILASVLGVTVAGLVAVSMRRKREAELDR